MGADHLTDEQIKALEEIVSRHKAAQRDFAKALGVLWNAQIDIAIASQNSALLERASGGPLKIFDDCSCCSVMA